MTRFKDWLAETVLGSDAARDNAPAQTARATGQVANQWLGDPKTSADQAALVSTGRQHRSGLNDRLLDAGARAVQKAGPLAKQTNAPAVAQVIQTNLGLPTVLTPPKPTAVKMMGRR